MSNSISTGRVKFFLENKGYGFVTDNISRTDHFFHFTGIADKEGIQKDDAVQYELENTDKGLKAVNIKKV